MVCAQRARKFKKVQAKKLVKSNKSSFFSREIAFLAVLNFSPVQILIFGQFWSCKKRESGQNWFLWFHDFFLVWTFLNFLAHCVREEIFGCTYNIQSRLQNFKNKPYLEAANNYEPIQSTSKMVGNLFSFLCRRCSPKRVYRKKMNNIIEVWRKIYFIKKRWQLLCIDILIN